MTTNKAPTMSELNEKVNGLTKANAALVQNLRKEREAGIALKTRIYSITEAIRFRQAEEAGRKAYSEDKPLAENPYDQDTLEELHFTWRSAWFAERTRACNDNDVQVLTDMLLEWATHEMGDQASEYLIGDAESNGISEIWKHNFFTFPENEEIEIEDTKNMVIEADKKKKDPHPSGNGKGLPAKV